MPRALGEFSKIQFAEVTGIKARASDVIDEPTTKPETQGCSYAY
jgi:hypothetical protein